MRIAYVIPYVPNLIRVRSYNLLMQLLSLGIDVTLFTVSIDDNDATDAIALKSKLADLFVHDQPLWRSLMNCMIALPSKNPLQSVFSWNPHLQADLTAGRGSGDSREKFDLVHVEHLRGSKYGVLVKAMFPEMPVVWDSVDCISHLFEQTSTQSRSLAGKLMSALELKRTRRAEGELACLFDHVVITSQVDRDALLRLVPSGRVAAPVSILPNGVDIEYFRRNTDQPRDAETIVFSGKMSYHANISMVDYLVSEIMPKVWAKRPAVKLMVVGKDPPRKIRELTRNPLIDVTGTVVDIRSYLWKATVAVVPLVYGAGIQNKILEAMASETPVITTSPAFSSLRAIPRTDALVADNAEDFSAAILRLIENPTLRREVGRAGFDYVKNHHSWDTIGSELVAIYGKTTANKRT